MHYAFARHWFKVNLTTDLAGQIVETGDEQSGRFAFNCDIATPMRRPGGAVFAVDLFADVLVRTDSVRYQVCDLEDLDRAHRSGLILPEAHGAQDGLAELTCIIERGDLLAFLSQACAIGPLDPPPAGPPGRAPRPSSAARQRKPPRLARRSPGQGSLKAVASTGWPAAGGGS